MALCDGAKIVHAVFDPRVLASLVDFATFICMLESFKIHLIIPKTIKKKVLRFREIRAVPSEAFKGAGNPENMIRK